MPDFLYKPEYVDTNEDGSESEVVPGQIHVWFGAGESAVEWMSWLVQHGFPSPIGTLYFFSDDCEVRERDYAVWSPSQEHMMLHRLTWGGRMAVD